ncbi:hypothetical protein SBOR_9065 [Sclerotinia borealis F-4128]|uniref:Uncharacterized protein n=1 Tax=Sclerotinia borealis (strain F-4128) TaxID=1432307 RepID=W9C4C0_SCLBF|nr:hypothetical protein SBOR_9065 [Sclerotinia borealis F-4128]
MAQFEELTDTIRGDDLKIVVKLPDDAIVLTTRADLFGSSFASSSSSTGNINGETFDNRSGPQTFQDT